MTSWLLAVLSCLTLVALASGQAILSVPSVFPTITAAITAANNGDIVEVAPGTYVETDISFQGKAITVRSTMGPTMTVIDAQMGARCVLFQSGETSASRLTGFTLTNGLVGGGNSTIPRSGGAIRCFGASPMIKDCNFEANAARSDPTSDGGYGGAVALFSGSMPVFRSCRFSGNQAGNAGASATTGGWGGAVYVDALSTGTFEDCTFDANRAGFGMPCVSPFGCPPGAGSGEMASGGNGGAVAAEGVCTFVRCELTLNLAGAPSGGGFIYPGGSGGSGGAVYLASGTFLDCTFSGNFSNSGASGDPYGGSGGRGGAICATSTTVATTITRCEFRNNTSGNGGAGYNVTGPAGRGGAVFLNAGQVTGCTFAFNQAGVGYSFGGCVSGLGAAVWTAGTVTSSTFFGNQAAPCPGPPPAYAVAGASSMTNCIVWNNPSGEIEPGITTSYCVVSGGAPPGAGNVSADPMFRDPATADLRLLPGSPAIDTGDPATIVLVGAIDLEGDPRLIGQGIDIGADEFCLLGNGGDLAVESEVNGGGNRTICSKLAQPGDTVALDVFSPLASMTGQPVSIAFQAFVSSLPPTTGFLIPTLHVDPNAVILIPFQAFPNNGVTVTTTVPLALTGMTLRVQAFGAGTSGPAISGAHEIVVP
ncbi:MAG: hypothetical protein CMJ83_18950 [Planctomycetes bacterium]|nr:hypothetical protein [Planctomycetota bacterium]